MSNKPPEQPQLPPSITAKHELTRLLRELIPDVKTGVVDDFHSVIDRFEAAPAEGGQTTTYELLLKQLADQKRLIDSSVGNCPLCQWGGTDTHRSDCPFMLAAELATPSSTPRPAEEQFCTKCGQPKDPNSAICQRYYEDSARICANDSFSRVEQPQIPIGGRNGHVHKWRYIQVAVGTDYERCATCFALRQACSRQPSSKHPQSEAIRRAAEKLKPFFTNHVDAADRAGILATTTSEVAAIIESELKGE